MPRDDHRLVEAKGVPLAELVARLGLDVSLKRAGHEWTGPCPQCGGDDRFSVNVTKQKWNCRGCRAKGDAPGLVMHVMGLALPAALDWMLSPDTTVSPEERARRAAEAAARAEAAAKKAAEERARAIKSAKALWARGLPAEGTAVRGYLDRRGISLDRLPVMPRCLRFHPDLALGLGEGPERRELHRGPAMLAAVTDARMRLIAVHRTWIDLAQPKGKAVVPHPDRPGDTLPAKKILGSKKGGFIALTWPVPEACDTLVMGEGIETTLSAMVAEVVPNAAYFAGVDLGNMAGGGVPIIGVRTSDRPDLGDAEAFVPPLWVRRLVYVQDGDSDPTATRAKLLRGLRRALALRPGLTAAIVHAGQGRDLNDVLRGE